MRYERGLFCGLRQPDYCGAVRAGNLLRGDSAPGGLFPCVVSSLAAGTVARAMGVRAMRFISPPPPPTCCSMDRCWCWGSPAAC
ncbi:MAG: hypothetical protein ACLR1T_16730 [Evtepia gabavorous]